MLFEELPPISVQMTKYEMLGVSMHASADEVHRGYRRMAMLYHPDRHREDDRAGAEAAFQQISAAFQVLSDPRKRERYDQALLSGEEYTDAITGQGNIDLRDVLRGMEEYEDPRDEHVLVGTLEELSSLVAENLIHEIGEHVVDAWPMGSKPPGAKIEGSFKVGAAVLTNVRLLLPFKSQWETTQGNVKTKHTAAYMLVCALHLTNRIELEEKDKLNRSLQVRFVQDERTVEFKTERHNLGRLLLVARKWGVPVLGSLSVDRVRERKWALGPVRAIPWIAIAYLVVISGGYFMFTGDGLFASIKDGGGSFYPFGAWICMIWVVWSVYRLRLWILTYRTYDLSAMNQMGISADIPTEMQVAEQ